jgi:signal transduction histidine kinase/HAMP domain-containing protein
MQSFITLIDHAPYIIFFQNLSGWIIWGLLFVILIAVVVRNWRMGQPHALVNLLPCILLLISIPLCSLYLGIRFPVDQLSPLPGTITDPQVPSIVFLAALPILVWAGASGLSAAVVSGLLIGLLRALWETHTLFTPIEYGFVAVLITVFMRQDYRTRLYGFLRHPLGSAITTAILSSPLYILSMFITVQGTIPVKLDYAFTQTYPLMIARAIELIIAATIVELLLLFHMIPWYKPKLLKPSPSEASIQARFFNRIAPLLLVLLVGLILGDWLIANRAARALMQDRLESTASIAAKNLPYFMETGQNLLINLADVDLMDLSTEETETALAERLRVVPYFQQLFLFDAAGNPITGYPLTNYEELMPSKEERTGLTFTMHGVLIQTYPIQPSQESQTAQISMIAAIRDENGELRGILLGRTDLNENPYTQPAILALDEINDMGGEGIIVDENNRILYHPIASLVMSEYIGNIPAEPGFYDDVLPNGNKAYLYYAAVVGRPWKVLLTVPVEQSQQTALNIAFPLFILILIFSAVVFLSLRYGLNAVTGSLNRLAKEAAAVASGELDSPLQIHRDDEVGKFSQTFERMRVRLKRRLEELNGLLKVSEGVARHIEIDHSINKILEVAQTQGADSVRILLREQSLNSPEKSPLRVFSAGKMTDVYAELDQQMMDMMVGEEQLIIPNTARMRRIRGKNNKPHPGAIVALALRMEENDYGVLWLGYESPRPFDAEQIQFLNTLSYHTSIAAANASLFSSAVVGRQRLEAVLRATPEPVLVLDEHKNVILINPAALNVDGLVHGTEINRPLEEVVNNKDIRKLLLETPASPFDSSAEVNLPNGQSYEVTLSPVQISAELPAGVVCTLRDITRYKQQDSMKSDFVATVSHDLRVPLSMLRGYVTMLPMVGEINEQQKEYLEKIQTSVERMSKLTQNVLNVQRIEAGIALDIKSVDPEKVVQLVNQILSPQAIQKKIELTHLVSPANGEKVNLIEADADLLQQALYNLVENAIKFTPVKGTVCVQYEEVGDESIFSVQDTGSGIAPLDLDGIFSRKRQKSDAEGEESQVNGYGLTIVRSIAQRHHGRTWVESVLGKGSVFYLSIPQKQRQD